MESWHSKNGGPPPPARRDRWRRSRDKNNREPEGDDSRSDFSRRSPNWRRSPEREPRRIGDVYGPPPGLGQSQGGYNRWPPPPPPSPPRHSQPPPPPPPRNDDYHYRPSDRSDRYNDSPRPPQGDFSFRMDKPPGVGESRDAPHHHQHRRRGGGGRGGHGGYQYRKRLAADRPMLSLAQTASSAEITMGVDDTRSKYRAVEDLSEDGSDVQVDSRQDGPSSKRVRVETTPTPVDNVPKWSNPDPYSVLPPTETGSRKTTTIIDLIQKARIDTDEKKAVNTVVEDFISFDLDEDSKSEQSNRRARSRSFSPSRGARQHSKSPRRKSASGRETRETIMTRRENDPLGSRKRNIDDNLKPPSYMKNKAKAFREASLGVLTPEWVPVSGQDDCPWNTKDCTDAPQLNLWFHQEILDFYEHVKPRAFEHKIRTKLVENLQNVLRRDSMFRSITIYPFGSYASDLYLPTGDMDLVVCSQSFLNGEMPAVAGSRWLHRFRAALVRYNLAEADTIELILHAKVPLVKYIDRESGLRVDVSFENLTGVDAIETFKAWKKTYPAMPILVTVIKHFLGMRGLNEPVNGGIGGFSVVCLVVSMFQLIPQVQSRSLEAENHLGEMLIEFFKLYGKSFNYNIVAIRMDPPGYMLKSRATQIVYKGNNQRKLSIIDPNNPANDISGGSTNFPIIQTCFEKAYDQLKDAMTNKGIANGNRGRSVLRSILSGNYSTFRQQREYLRQLHKKRYGPCEG